MFFPFHLKYFSLYVFGCLKRSDYFVWSWNNYHFISSPLINFLLAYIFFYFILWFYCSLYVVGYLIKSDFSLWLWNRCLLKISSLIDSLLTEVFMLFFIWILVVGMLSTVWKTIFLCSVVQYLLCHIKFIGWFRSCLDLYNVSFFI